MVCLKKSVSITKPIGSLYVITAVEVLNVLKFQFIYKRFCNVLQMLTKTIDQVDDEEWVDELAAAVADQLSLYMSKPAEKVLAVCLL